MATDVTTKPERMPHHDGKCMIMRIFGGMDVGVMIPTGILKWDSTRNSAKTPGILTE